MAWLGHACLWIALLNNLYGRPISKSFLKCWRHFTGVWILAFPAIMYLGGTPHFADGDFDWNSWNMLSFELSFVYFLAMALVGGTILPFITLDRLLRPPPASMLATQTRTLDFWPELGAKLLGDGKWRHIARLPFNGIFRVDFTEMTLAVPKLPAAWDGLSILLLSDWHFCGTPSEAYYLRVIEEIEKQPTADIIALAGDYLDTDEHRKWIVPLLGRLKATEGKFAILGNHDVKYEPDRMRAELTEAGYSIVSNSAMIATIRSVEAVVIGHEGPWFRPAPDLSDVPKDRFRMCISHTPDNFYWGQANGINLMLCGHVHGGQIRLPIVGSIFVPSRYGRRFDMGTFDENGTQMVVSRGLSGKEALRFRCNPEVVRVVLRNKESVAGSPASR